MAVELKVPEVGESITEVMIGKWLVEEGQSVGKDDPVVEIETDKVTLELPAPVAGTVTKHGKAQGDEATVGDVIGFMEEGAAGEAGGGKKAETKAVAAGEDSRQSNGTAAAVTEKQAEPGRGKAVGRGASPKPDAAEPTQATPREAADEHRVMPAARRMLDENNLTAEDVEPTGRGGRLLKEDVQRYLQQHPRKADGTPAPAPAAKPEKVAESVEPAEVGEDEERVAMSPMRRRIAQRLVEAQQTAALLTTFNEIDMSAVMDLRNRYKESFQKKFGVKLGFMSFFVKAAIDALKSLPAVNAEIRGTDIIYKNHYDIGIAVGTGKGLVVPILRNAEAMSFADIELAIGDFASRIQENKLKLEELQGGTFTITNGGVFGSLLSTPIVNPPQSAVLGMHSIQKRPIAVGDEVKIRPMMYVALTYDHRLVDGREAVTFLKRIKETIEEPSRMLMEV